MVIYDSPSGTVTFGGIFEALYPFKSGPINHIVASDVLCLTICLYQKKNPHIPNIYMHKQIKIFTDIKDTQHTIYD